MNKYIIIEREGSLGTETTVTAYLHPDPAALLEELLKKALDEKGIVIDVNNDDFDDVLNDNDIYYHAGDSLSINNNDGWIRYDVTALKDWVIKHPVK